MSHGTFGADTDALARAGATFSQLAATAERVTKLLETQIVGIGECWGDDEIGKQFAKDYLPARKQILEALPSIAKVMRKTGDGVTVMAKGLANGEDQAKLLADMLRGMSSDAPAGGSPGTGDGPNPGGSNPSPNPGGGGGGRR